MTWKEHYKIIKFEKEYFLPESDEEKILLYIALFFIALFLVSTISYLGNIISFILFSIFIILFSIFIFKFLISFIYITSSKVYYNVDKNHLLGFKQSSYFKEYIRDKQVKKVFFITWLGKKENNKKLKKAIYFYANYQFLKNLKTHKTHKYITNYIIISFLMSSIAFYGLILELNSLKIDNNNHNLLFLFSIMYILYIIYASYSPFLDKNQRNYFKSYIKGFSQNYFLVDDNLDTALEDSKKTSDVLGIVFGVLFSLYITLAYSTIYTVGVDIKKISIEKRDNQ